MSGKVSDNVGRSSGLVKAAPGGISTIAGDKSSPTVGDVWYNSSTGKLRTYIAANAWSAGGDLGTARGEIEGFGTSGAAACAGGNHPALGTTEEYDGSSWSAGGNTGVDAHGHSAAGLQTAGIKSSGYTSDYQAGSEIYDGSAWSSITNLPGNRYESGSLGTQTAYGTFCGATTSGGSSTSDTMDIWNGSSWATGGTTNQAGHYVTGCGTTSAGLKVGGLFPTNTVVDDVEEYNGTDWTAVPNYPAVRSHLMVGGLQTDAMSVGGTTDNSSTYLQTAYTYDGTNWTSVTNYPIECIMGGISRNDATASDNTLVWGGTDHTISPSAKTVKTYHWLGTGTLSISTE